MITFVAGKDKQRIFPGHLHFVNLTHSINKKEKSSPQARKERLYAKLFLCRSCRSRLQHAGSGAPRADAVGDATQGLEIGPLGELVVFGCGRDVCADNTHREVRDVGEGNLGAIELEGNLLAGC